MVGYRLDLESLSLTARLSGCTSGFENESVRARTDEFGLSIAATHTWDWELWSAYLGLGLGGTLTQQSFETRGEAPSRLSLSPVGHVVLGSNLAIHERYYVGIEANLEGHLLEFQETTVSASEYTPAAALRGMLLGGVQF